ncbi:MAG TPA: LamG domain-containing protein, partial [Clostridiales bacterium]|nr:LamG domain-containing protein [Clostridiales bacterium]
NGIDVGYYSSPAFTDLDGDGLLDVLIGEKDGNIKYYKQAGISDISFGNVLLGNSPVKKYYVVAQDLKSDLNLTVSSEFNISLSQNTGYSNSLSITPVNGIVSDTIFVKFSPIENIEYNGTITHSSTDCETKYITLTGIGAGIGNAPVTALDFDGVNDYATIADDSSLDLTNNYTIEAWIKPSVFATMAGIVSKYQTSSANGYSLRLSSISPYTGLTFDELSTSNGILEEGKWYHIAAVNNNGTRRLYLNGVEQTLTGTPLTVNSNSDPLRIGVDFNSRYFDGKIEEVRLWNTVRSLQEIRENIHLPLDGSETGLVSYWQFNEGSGTTASDLISGNLGTLTNMDDTDWVNSTIPFGDGHVNSQIVSTTGIVDFTGTGVSMNVTSKTGTDTLVVSKINLPPNINPYPVTIFDSQYWVVHKFGTGMLSADISLTLSEDLTSNDESNPAKIKLYTRASTSDSSWTYNLTAVSVDAATNTVNFSGITDFSQLIITSDNLSIPQNIVTEIIGLDIKIIWDAVHGATSYKVYASDDPYGSFQDVSASGIFDGTSWTIAHSESKKFYYVVAVSGTKRPINNADIKNIK